MGEQGSSTAGPCHAHSDGKHWVTAGESRKGRPRTRRVAAGYRRWREGLRGGSAECEPHLDGGERHRRIRRSLLKADQQVGSRLDLTGDAVR